MFHFFVWEILDKDKKKYLLNNMFWIEVIYAWNSVSWEFFLHPHIDQTNNTIVYYAFDSVDQKLLFETMHKISWIWPKTAFHISMKSRDQMQEAIESFDVKFFQSIPWVWPKTAKRLLVELKNSFSKDDIDKLDIDQKFYKDIISSLKWLGYEVSKIKKLLQSCPIELKKENLWEIIKWVIDNI